MGEASHPGPAQFHVYSANVTGLGNKAPLLDGHTAAAWCVQETHLTLFGQKAFMRSANFRAKENHQRPWKAAWGHPCPARGCSIPGGTTTGTTILANQPIRSMLLSARSTDSHFPDHHGHYSSWHTMDDSRIVLWLRPKWQSSRPSGRHGLATTSIGRAHVSIYPSASHPVWGHEPQSH